MPKNKKKRRGEGRRRRRRNNVGGKNSPGLGARLAELSWVLLQFSRDTVSFVLEKLKTF